MGKKVVIATAGRGTRMLFLTKNKPKHLIKIRKRPFLAYVLDNILKAGFKQLIIVVGYKAEKVKEFLREYYYKATLINQFEILGKDEYGSACPLKCVKDVIGEEDFLKKIVEKPKKYVGNLINAGLYKFTPEVFEKVSEIQPSPRGEYEITDVISLLAQEKKVKIKKIEDFWLDFGNPADIIKISQFLKTSKNFK